MEESRSRRIEEVEDRGGGGSRKKRRIEEVEDREGGVSRKRRIEEDRGGG